MGSLRDEGPDRIGPYQLLGYLGRGGQGLVYKARHPDGRTVALKRLHTDLNQDEKVRARFLREAEAARRVAGFCTAQVIDTGVDDDGPYIVSEYVEGESLQRTVDREGPRSTAQMERLMVGTLTALSAIHQAGIVHRDLKPTNVLLSPDGPRVVDFGVARLLEEDATVSGVVGTPAYVAPEQFEGRCGESADMFAWAASMYFAATGTVAFGSGTPPTIMYRVMNEEPDLAPLPEQLRPILAKCLHKDPALRPDATSLLLTMLGGAGGTTMLGERLAAAPATHDRNSPPPGPARAVTRRAALAFGGALALGGAYWGGTKASNSGAGASVGQTPATTRLAPGASRALVGHNDKISAVCFGMVEGNPVVISGSDDQTVRVWDPSTGRQLGPSLTGHKRWIGSVAFIQSEAVPLAVSVGDDRMVHLWDLHLMQRRASFAGHRGPVRALVTGHIDGTPIAVTGGGDQTARVWNLDAGKQIGDPFTGFGQFVTTAALAERQFQQVVIVGDALGKITTFDLVTREPVGTPISAHDGAINALSVGMHDGHWVVFSAGTDQSVKGWDVITGERRWEFRGHAQSVQAVQFGIVNNRDVVVSGSDDKTIRFWDLATAKQSGEPLVGHTMGVRALAIGLVDGVTCIVSSSLDQTVRIWRPL
ncbi:MAG: serine/threonine-protein kinase [Streptosporangiaceae bacterium]